MNIKVSTILGNTEKHLNSKMPSNFSNYIYANNGCAGAGWNVSITRVGQTLDYTLSYSLAGDYNWFHSRTVTLNYITNPTYEYSAWYGRDSSGIKVDLRQGKVWGLYCRASWGQIGSLF